MRVPRGTFQMQGTPFMVKCASDTRVEDPTVGVTGSQARLEGTHDPRGVVRQSPRRSRLHTAPSRWQKVFTRDEQ